VFTAASGFCTPPATITAASWAPTPSKALRELSATTTASGLTAPTRRSSDRATRCDRSLKDEVGDLYLNGSGTLVRAMPADGLIDELPLFGYPSR